MYLLDTYLKYVLPKFPFLIQVFNYDYHVVNANNIRSRSINKPYKLV